MIASKPLAIVFGVLISATALATATPPPPPKPAPSKPKPPGPPVINDVTTAYQFRTQVLMSPQCLSFANEADAVFLSNSISDEQKTERLARIETSAKQANCLQ